MGEHRTRFSPGDEVWVHYEDDDLQKHVVSGVVGSIIVAKSGVMYRIMPQDKLYADDQVYDAQATAKKIADKK